MSVHLYPFSLSFSGSSSNEAAFFSFFFDNEPLNDISCLISHCAIGDMGVQKFERRRRFVKTLGIDTEKLFACSQTHSQKVAVIGKQNSPSLLADADGLITNISGIYLSVTVADCLPVYLFDAESKVFGVVHSGWKGTGIVLNALKEMNPRSTAAILGPCICKDCYTVDDARARYFEKTFGGQGEYPLGYIVKENRLDLQAANAKLLADAGVKNIAYCSDCTFTDTRLGSFRREGENFTRMMAIIGRPALR
jgi:YfiH family protein